MFSFSDCDAGITVVRKEKHQLIEKYRTKCRDFVRTSIAERFVKFLDEIIGRPVIQEYKYKNASEYIDMYRSIRTIMDKINTNENGVIHVLLPLCFLDTISHETRKRDFKSLVESSRFSENVRMKKDKMCIDIEILRKLVKPTIEKVESLFETVFDEYKNETKEMDIVIIGGFADYKILQEVVRQRFLTQRIYIPIRHELVVVNGAVLCGFNAYQYIRSLSSEVRSYSNV